MQSNRQTSDMITISKRDDLDTALGQDRVFIFKHSPICGISARAYAQVQEFAVNNNTPVYLIDVIQSRPVSQEIARRLGIDHQSPQIILVQKGVPVWHISHYRITMESMSEALSKITEA